MNKKGQLEFVVIAALIVILIVAMIFVLQQLLIRPPEVSGIEQQAKTVKESVNNLVGTGLNEVLIEIFNHGGYTNLGDVETVKFDMLDVPVWQRCEITNIPNVTEEIGYGVDIYLRNKLKEEMIFFGKKVEFDFSKMETDVSIWKDRVDVNVYLPTKIEGYEIPLPYTGSIRTNLFEILDFSKNFVEDAKETRFFELITMTTILYSNPEYKYFLPLVGTRFKCYDPLIKRKDEMLKGINETLDYVATHTVWNTNPIRLASNPFYPLNRIGGKKYDLYVMFSYPKEWNLKNNFYFSPDPFKSVPKPLSIDVGGLSIPIPLVCMDTYGVSYSIRYPVVVSVKDEITNQWFKFAVMNEIRDNKPGNCEGELKVSKEKLCKEGGCVIKMKVKDEEGNLVKGADVMFYRCDLGKTNSDGEVMANVPCGVSEIKVYKKGYKTFGNLTSYFELNNSVIILERTGEVTIHFYGIPMRGEGYDENEGTYDSYKVSSYTTTHIKPITKFTGKDFDIWTHPTESAVIVNLIFKPNFKNIFTGEDIDLMLTNVVNLTTFELGDSVKTYGISHNTYDISGIARNRLKDEQEVGYMNGTIEIGNETNLYVYFPIITNEDAKGISVTETGKLMEILKDCGVEAISLEMQELNVNNPNCPVS
jgi:hypothetical protein